MVLAAQETVGGLVCLSATLLLWVWAVVVVGAVVGEPFVENQAYFEERMPLVMVDPEADRQSRYV